MTFLAWLIELIGFLISLLIIFLKFGSITTRSLQNVTGVIYFVITPSAYLINNYTKVKLYILDSSVYIGITNQFFSHTIHQIVPSDIKSKSL